ncbi:DUF992 domain-containing protein [Xanthobacter autotrophicus DSM 431]|uniref:DUF992 domain-containing protein n=1 Tax=Xanthobacter nonsaccharivorans TaxID=3119912 RepID=UPI00372C780B
MKTVVKAGLAAVALLAAGAVPASAQSRVQVGTLVCSLAPNISFVIGSVREMSCSFRPSVRGAKGGSYQGTVRRLGLDIGFSGSGELVWGVFAPSAKVGKGALRGTYVGASSNASIGVGLGANVLVGGSQNTFALQPLSVQGQTGLNLALGVSDLTLR